MKKVSLLGFILAATAGHFAIADAVVEGAATQPGCPKAFQGFHLGGNIGYGIGVVKQKHAHATRAVAAGSPFVVDRRFSNDLGVNGVDGGIGVGYTYRLCNWALGLAFDANWAGSDGTFKEALGSPTFNTVTAKASLRNSLQLYGRLGYVIREVAMPFIGLGWENAQWKQNTRLDIAAVPGVAGGPGLPGFSRSANKSKRLNAFMWKAGVDFLATRHVVVGIEYTGSTAGRKKVSNTFVNPQDGETEVLFSSIKPQYNKVALTAKIVY